MLEIKFFREAPSLIKEGLNRRGWEDTSLVDQIVALDAEWRMLTTAAQSFQAQANAAAKAIGTLMRNNDRSAAQTKIQETSDLKNKVRESTQEAQEARKRLKKLLVHIPNVPHISVPVGRTDADNFVMYERGKLPDFAFKPRAHWKLAEKHKLVDFSRGTKVAGAGFPFYIGRGAQIQRALIQFFLTEARLAGYLEIQSPLLVNAYSAFGTGQLPDKEGQMYHLRDDALYLVPTGEVPLTNFYRDEIFQETDLPLKVCGHTPCWRREAGSHGRDVRGLNRLHQFDKVEIVQITHPDHSHDALEAMVGHAEGLLEKLELPYRRILMCTGDMGFNQTKQYDLEVWSAGQKRWLEVSSISNFETYQSERMKMRYHPEDGRQTRLVHTLNGSALALPRILIAILENNQCKDGTVKIPAVLGRYAGMGPNWVIGQPQPSDAKKHSSIS